MPPLAHYEFYNDIAEKYTSNEVITPLPVSSKEDPTTPVENLPKSDCNEEVIMNIISTETMVLGSIIFAIVQILMIGIIFKLGTKTSHW